MKEPLFSAGERFSIRRRLGAGGMGVVYEAYDQERHEVVALKTLRRVDPRRLAQIRNEFRSLHDLSHPNLVSLGELFDGDSGPFFTMELVGGVDFLSYVRGGDSMGHCGRVVNPAATTAPNGLASTDLQPMFFGLPPDPADPDAGPGPSQQPRLIEPIAFDEARLRASLRQLALGIATLHDAGKVHRDIKPSNIMVTDQGRVVLLDFGLAADAEPHLHGVTPQVAGTAAYMAPEQAYAGDVSPAADWYSLGVLLFEALTGVLPHVGSSSLELILSKQQGTLASPSDLVPELPADLDRLCVALLQPDAGARPSAREVFDQLGIDTNHGLVLDHRPRMVEPLVAPVFVGRSWELAELHTAYQRRGPTICLVEGVSGVGKSQLVEVFLERLLVDQPDTLIFASRCYEREVVSYKAIDGIADDLIDHLLRLPPAEVAELMPRRPELLGRLFQGFYQVAAIANADKVTEAADPHEQRRRVFGALRELFSRLARRRRLVWYIDDLQWTDADSMVLLQDLLADPDALPVFLVATVRPPDSEQGEALVDQVSALAPTRRLVLDELPPGEARTLAGLLLPECDPKTVDEMATDAGGHPLFLHELARHVDVSNGSATTGASLDEMLAGRIARLPGPARRLLRVVSVAAGPMSQETAAMAAELSSSEQVRAARVLCAGHLVRTDGVRPTDRIVVYHDRVREHVATSLDEARLRHLHKRLALALERTGAAEREPRALVHHARAAGRRAMAASYALRAAHLAVEALVFEQAAEFFTLAMELGSYGEDALRELRIDLAAALVNTGRGPEAAEQFMAAADGAEPSVRLDCQRRAAEQWLITGHLPAGLAALQASLSDVGEVLARTPRRALLRVGWNRLRLRLRGLRYSVRPEAEIASAELRHLDALKTVAHGLAMVDNVRGADFNGRFLLRALRVGEPRRLVQAMGAEVVFLASQGGRAGRRARRVFAELARLAEQSPDDAYMRAWVLLSDGAASFFEGRFAAAASALEESEMVIAGQPEGTTYERNNTRVFRAHALRQLGALRYSGALIAESVRSGRQRGDRYLETTLRFLQVEVLLGRADPEGARRSLAEGAWSPLEEGFHTQHWHELEARVELALYERSAGQALVELTPTFAVLRNSLLLRVGTIRAVALGLRGRLLLSAARERGGSGAVAEVLALAHQLERERSGYATVFALLLRAGVAAIDDRVSDGDTAAHLRRAVDAADGASMALHLATARHRLGVLLGGDEGAALCDAAAAWATAEGVVDAERLFGLVEPGLVS